MRKGIFYTLYAFAVTFAAFTATNAGAYTYVVKKGNSLSKITGQLVPGPAWGKNGSLKKVLALNPQIQNPNFILPGQIINIDGILSNEQVQCAGLERMPAAVDEVESPSEETSNAPAPVAAEPVAPPAPADVEKAPAFKRRAVVALIPFYTLSGITAKDNTSGITSTFASLYNAGIRAAYIQEWTPSTQSFVSLKFSQIAFEQPTDSSRSIVNSKAFLSGVALGLSTGLTSRLNLELSADYQKEVFARAVSTQSATIDAVTIPSLGAKISFDIVDLDPFVLGLSSLVLIKMSTTTDAYIVKMGTQYGAIIYLKQFVGDNEASNFQTELSFTARDQGTSLIHQIQTDLTLGLRYFFPVGRRQKGGT